MESIIESNPPLKGKCFSCIETSVKLTPYDTSLKALTTSCLFGKVLAPMVVDESNVTEFVAKNWKIQVSVVALVDEDKPYNVFQFGFECPDHRNWALNNGPWCVRGYSLVLQAWSPTFDGPTAFKLLRVWIQIHHLPQEYFSKANGNLLGGLAGTVVQVELDEEKPASWSKFLKVQVDIEVDKPLFSGCFFDLASGVKKWVQMKYEKIGIFCYFCGCLGHQRKGCSFTTPVTVSNLDGIPFPMFGPWISTLSAYQSVFSGMLPGASRSISVSAGRKNGDSVLLLPATSGDGDGGSKGLPPTLSRRPRHQVKGTSQATDGIGKSNRAMWFPKSSPHTVKKAVAKSGYGGEKSGLAGRKAPENFPNLCDASQDINLNADKGLNLLTVKESIMKAGPSVIGPWGMNLLKEGLNGLSGDGPNNNVMSKGKDVSGLQLIPSKHQGGGPVMEKTHSGPNCKDGLVNPCVLGSDSIPNGPTSLDKDHGGLVGGNASMSSEFHGAQEQLNEEKALAQFFQAQESLLHDLKHFGKLDLYEIRSIGGDIGVPASSEVNERTTPFKKRKFESSASLCVRPHKVPRKYPDVVRDFPWDTTNKVSNPETLRRTALVLRAARAS
ncbi:hypothetical protein F8388_012990 [Cannabis sativa]|uniref:CCHC-type domain-containing protein n=1 Tax=Cannabis sativa TaxID=3483 RepID=A0A7J6HEJ4_CANSA|nr:hypothetical protein F8388_012990 [Cannabis sativa]KAF4393757.1 hypothetical protein G4B88_007743 [Cannabis sativa]